PLSVKCSLIASPACPPPTINTSVSESTMTLHARSRNCLGAERRFRHSIYLNARLPALRNLVRHYCHLQFKLLLAIEGASCFVERTFSVERDNCRITHARQGSAGSVCVSHRCATR